MRCPACGEEVVAEAMYCHKCGQRLDAERERRLSQDPPVRGIEPAEAFQQAAARRDRKPTDQPEEELWRGGYSSKAMIGSWVISGCISIASPACRRFLMPQTAVYWLILVVAMLLPWLYYLAVLSYRRMSVHYVLSTQRFIHERGILRRVNDRIELLDVDDITFEQRLWERMVGVGTLRIASHDRTDPELVLPGIENIKRVAGLFDNARLAERRRRGLHVEQI